jgi:hypothetical protein
MSLMKHPCSVSMEQTMTEIDRQNKIKIMTNPKTDHKNGKPTTTAHSSRRDSSAPPERQTSASATMIEACDRLSLKFDEVAGLFGEQMEAWRQLRPPALSRPAPRKNAVHRDAAATLPPAPASEDAGARGQDEPPGAPAEDGLAAMAGDAHRLVDTLSRAGGGWPEQAAGVGQALEAMMAYLEKQAATAAPKVDADGIMSRLRDLEERQQNLQSQFNASR